MTELIGEQIRFVSKVIDAHRRPVDAGVSPKEATERGQLAILYTRVIMQAGISAAVVAVCLWIIATSSNETAQKGAFGLLGTVLGYWLR